MRFLPATSNCRLKRKLITLISEVPLVVSILVATLLLGTVCGFSAGAPSDSKADRSKLSRAAKIVSLRQGLLPIQRRIMDMLEAQSHQVRDRAYCFAPGTTHAYMEAYYQSQSVAVGPQPFRPDDRWTSTATDGGGIPRGTPITLTWSILNDGASTDTSDVSDLQAFLNTIYGNQATWQALMQQVFDRWSELTGISYIFEPNDDGAAFPGTAGALGIRGDVRVGGHNIDGPSGTLAYNFYPNSGDMIIDTQDTFYNNTSGNSLNFRNVFSHEHGHGMGLAHTCPITQTILMEPFVTSAFDGPQHDDILSANRNYGDRYGANNSSGAASDLGTLSDGLTSVTILSIATAGDVDYYKFNTSSGSRRATVTMSPVGLTYLEGAQNADGSCQAGTSFNSLTLRNLGLEVIDSNGSSVLANAASGGAGVDETILNLDLGGGSGPFFIRVFGSDTTDNVQLYDLAITLVDGTPQPEMAVFGNGIEIADGDTTPQLGDATDFGVIGLGQTFTNVYTITNSGVLTLNLTSPILSGSGAGDFIASALGTTTLSPGSGTSFSVIFTASNVGVRNATISIDNNDFTENPYDFAISGSGFEVPEIAIFGKSFEILDGDLSPSTLDGTDYGQVDILAGLGTQIFTITNSGLTNLTLTLPVTLSGPDVADFSITVQPAADIPAGTSTSFTVTFDPSTSGIKNATVNVINDDTDESPYDFAIQGTAGMAPEIDVSGAGQSIADGDTTPTPADNTDFGNTGIAAGNITRTFVITNSGSATLTLSLPGITGTHAFDFAVIAQPLTTIPPGTDTSFQIAFDPSAGGQRGAVITILNNDSDENPYSFSVLGTGVLEPEVEVLGNGFVILDGDTTPSITDGTDFGNAVLGVDTVVRTFDISSIGSSNIVLSLPVSITGPGAVDFSVTAIPAGTIVPGAATTLGITFDPTGTGVRTATVSFGNNDSDENPYNFTIAGTATEAEIAVFGNSVLIVDGDTTPSIADNTDFGSEDVVIGGASRSFVITNSGDAVLSISQPINFSGPAAADFRVTSISGISIPPGGTATMNVLFNPTGTGTRDATISMANNDANENPYDFALRGIGTGPEIEVTGSGVVILAGATITTTADNTDFGNVLVGSGSKANTFVVRNTGTGEVLLTLPVTVEGGDAGDFFVSSQPGTNRLGPGVSTTFVIAFDPVDGGQRFSSVTLINTDSDENPFTFAVSGLGGGPEIDVLGNGVVITNGATTASNLDGTSFGAADVSSGAIPRQFIITNGGTTNLNITLPITVSGANAADFMIIANPPSSISSGNSGTFLVRFDPTASGSRNAVIAIDSDDVSEPQYTFAVDGLGVIVPPTITAHPASKTLNALQDTTLFVAANGTAPLTYQWYKDGVPVPGGTNPSLVLINVTTAISGVYYATVSNLSGTATSASAQLTVNLLPTVTSWSNPATIVYGTPLGGAQLNAVASVSGTFTYSPVAGAELPAGAGAALNVTFTPSEATVYAGSAASVTIDVNPAPLTITADDKSRLITDANPSLTFTTTGFVFSDDESSLDQAPAISIDGGDPGTTPGSYQITVSGATDANYAITHVNGTLLVFDAAPAIQQQPASVIAGALSDVSFTVLATGAPTLSYQWKKDGVDIAGETGLTLTLNAVTTVENGNYSVVIMNGDGSVTSSAATLTVNKLNPIITWATPTAITYGTALSGSQLNASANVAGGFVYDAANQLGAILDAGGYTLMAVFTPSDTLNYNNATPSVSLTVDLAPLNVGVQNASREYNTANPSFVVTYTGFVNGEDSGVLTATATTTATPDLATLPGTYPINVAGATALNYVFSYSPGTLTVFASSPLITDEPDTLTVSVGDLASFTVVATGTAPLSYLWRHDGTNLVSATSATLSIGTTTLDDAGEYDVIVSNVGGSVTSLVATLTIFIPPTISSQPASATVPANGIATFSVVAQGSLPLTYQWQKNSVDIVGQTNFRLLLSNLSSEDAANYTVIVSNGAGSVTSDVATLTITKLVPVVTWNNPSLISYGTALGESQLNAIANIPGTFTYNPASSSVPAGGTQPLSVLFTPVDQNRYETVTENRSISVQKIPLSVAADNATREIGDANPAFTLSYTGFVNGDGPGDLTTPPTATSVADTASAVSTYPIIPAGGVSANYTFSYENGILTVVANPVTITQQPSSLVVNEGQSATFTVTVNGSDPKTYQWRRHGTNLNGETASSLNIASAQASDDAPYDVIISNLANSVTSSVVTLDVLLPSTITWPTPANISYGTLLSPIQLNATTVVPGTITYAQTAGDLLTAGTSALTLTFAPDDTAAFLPTNAMVNLTVDPAALTVTADDKTREFGASNPALTITFAGFVNGETTAALSSQASASTAADAATLPGGYPINVSGAVGDNYAVTHVPGTLTVFANLPVVTVPPVSITVTNGDPATFSATVTGTLPLGYQWRKDGGDLPGKTDPTLAIGAATVSDAGAYDLVVSNVGGSVTSTVANLTVLVPPAITVHPISQEFNALSDVTFTVTATGTAPLAYQWQKNGQPIQDATNSFLTLNSVSPVDVGAYSVTITNVAGVAMSTTATLSVNELAPDITWATPANITYGTALSSIQLNASTFIPGTFIYNPTSGTVLASGANTLNVAFTPDDTTNFVSTNASIQLVVDRAPLSVRATNVSREFNTANPSLPITYSGFVNGDDTSVLTSVPATSTTADINSLPGNYPITVGGAVALNYDITHNDGTLTVFADAPHITVNPVATTVISGSAIAFTVVATGTQPITYQWRHEGTNLPAENGATINIASVDLLIHPGAYDVVLTNVAGVRTSLVATLTVLVSPAITQQPLNVIADALGTAAFSVTATGTAPLNFQWRHDGFLLPNQTNSGLSLLNLRTNDAGAYTVSVFNGAGTITSGSANLEVNQLTSTVTWNNPAAIIYGTPLGAAQLNATANTPGTFDYTPALGTVLATGSTLLSVAFTASDPANHLPANGAVTLQVDPATLTVTADDKTREFGEANPSLTTTLSGFVNNENIGILTTQPMLTTVADTSSDLGGYAITVTGAAAPNYTVNNVSGTLTVFGIVPIIQQQPANVTTLEGTDASFTNIATGTSPLSWQWRKGGSAIVDATNSILTLTNVGILDNGGYDVIVSNIAGSVVSFPAILNVLFVPEFVQAPSSISVAAGQSTTLISAAIGTAPLTYQWFKNGGAIAGETNASLIFNSPTSTDSGSYHVTASNVAGTTASSPATLSVSQAPTIVQSPGNTTAMPNQTLTLSAQGFGEGTLTYIWSRGGVILQASTANTLAIANIGTSDVGIYDLTVTNAFGQAQAGQFLVTLAGPPLIITQPADFAVLPGTNIVFEVLVSGSQPLQYVWLKTGQPLSGENARTLSLPNVALSEAGLYSVAVANAFGVVLSDSGSLAVIATPLISVQPANVIASIGMTASLSVVADSAVSPTYQWRHSGLTLTNATKATLTLTNLMVTNAGDYDVIVVNPAGSVTSTVATLSVLLAPMITLEPLALTMIEGQNATFISAVAGADPLAFQWMRNGVDIPGANTTTLILNDLTRTAEGSYAMRANNPVGTIFSQTVLLRVLSPQVLTNLSGSRGQRFRLHFGAQSGSPLQVGDAGRFVVEVSSNLVDWDVVSSNGIGLVLTNGQFRFEDINAVIQLLRYYRVIEK